MKSHIYMSILCALSLILSSLEVQSQWNNMSTYFTTPNGINKVSIGNFAPNSMFHLKEPTSNFVYEQFNNRNTVTDGTQGLLVGLLGTYTTSQGVIMENNDAVLASQSGSLQFYTAQNNPVNLGQFHYSPFPPNPDRGNLRMIIKESTGYVGIGTKNPRGLVQIGDGNTKFVIGKMPGSQPLGYASMYFSFNGGRSSGNIWQFESDGSNNGGTVFITTPAGGLRIAAIKPGGNQASTQQISDQDVVDKTVFEITNEGRVLIGKPSVIYDPTNQLKVQIKGGLIAEKIKVALDNGSGSWNWPDYVFEKDYNLMSLTDIESFVNNFKHLPGIPSAEEVKSDGLDLGEINAMLLEKVEELTLHVIELNNRLIKIENK